MLVKLTLNILINLSNRLQLLALMATKLTSFCTAVISCNHSLSIILTFMLCKDLTIDNKELATNLEGTAILIPPLIL